VPPIGFRGLGQCDFGGAFYKITCTNLLMIINVQYKNMVGWGPLRSTGLGKIAPLSPYMGSPEQSMDSKKVTK